MLFTPRRQAFVSHERTHDALGAARRGMTCEGRGFGTARTRQVHPVVGRSPSVGWPSGKERSTPTRQVLPAEPRTAGTAGGTYGESKFARVRPDRLSWWVQAEAERVGYPLHLLMRMPKGSYVLALLCYLAIPVVVIGGAGVHRLIDPEMARGHADYARNYQLLEWVRRGALMTAAGLALVLWTLCCYLLLKSRQRSLRWLPLAAAGPFGFVVIATLQDRSPAPDDLYQQFIANLRTYWRVPFEIAVFVSVWVLAYQAVVLKRELMISFESFMTGTPTSTIIAQQNASSGMWAAGEGLEEIYLVALMYLLGPIVFNLVGHLFASPSHARQREPAQSSE